MKKALVGYGGHAREVMAQMGVKLTCFVDDQYVVEGTRPLSEFNPTEYALMIASDTLHLTFVSSLLKAKQQP